MDTVQDGLFVTVHYTGKLENGEVFDTSANRAPLEFQVGGGQIIQGFEANIKGMKVSEKKTFSLPPDQAYGERDETLERSFARDQIPSDVNPKVGDTVALQNQQGQQVPATVTAADDEKIVVDLNHPLAGKTLEFEVEVTGISDQPSQSSCGCGCSADCSDPGSGSCGEGCGSGGCC